MKIYLSTVISELFNILNGLRWIVVSESGHGVTALGYASSHLPSVF